MNGKTPRPPQEKKALSYARDRRNAYRENDKASRKLIPLRKAQESRQDRRKVAQDLSLLPKAGEEAGDLIESSARHDVHRVGGWTKLADMPLGESLAKGMKARNGRAGRRSPGRSAPEAPSPGGGREDQPVPATSRPVSDGAAGASPAVATRSELA